MRRQPPGMRAARVADFQQRTGLGIALTKEQKVKGGWTGGQYNEIALQESRTHAVGRPGKVAAPDGLPKGLRLCGALTHAGRPVPVQGVGCGRRTRLPGRRVYRIRQGRPGLQNIHWLWFGAFGWLIVLAVVIVHSQRRWQKGLQLRPLCTRKRIRRTALLGLTVRQGLP
jgi:hypothetical protein